ncbi:unnamed protein product [Chrysoparadoxa australica]
MGTDVELLIFNRRLVTVSDVTEIRRIMYARPHKFHRGKNTAKAFKDVGISDFIFTADGERWTKQKRHTSSSFSQANVKRMLPAITDITGQMMQLWDKVAERGGWIDGVDELSKATLMVISEVGMGHNLHLFEAGGAKEDKVTLAAVRQIMHTLQMKFFSLGFRIKWTIPFSALKREFRRKDAHLDALTDLLIAEERARLKSGNRVKEGKSTGLLLEKLVAASDNSEKTTLSDTEVRGNLKGYFLAGSDTTSRLMSWAMYQLSLPQYKEKRVRLQKELDTVMGDALLPDSHEMVESMVYLLAILKETMRFSSPINRVVVTNTEDWTTGDGRTYEPKTIFVLCANACQNMEKNFTKCNEFIPERWIPDEREAHLGPGCVHTEDAFLGFGAGPRVCPGKGLAFLEVSAVPIVGLSDAGCLLRGNIYIRQVSLTLISALPHRPWWCLQQLTDVLTPL